MRPLILGLHHDHIDGSRAVLDVLDDLYALAGTRCPFASAETLRAYFGNPLDDIVGRFGAVTGIMQCREALDLVGYAYGRRRAADRYRYVEAKFAPQYHTAGGLSMTAATAAIVGGLRRAERVFGIRILPVVCIGREADPETGVEIAKIALAYDGEVALDLACTEPGNPPEKHFDAYRLTFGSKVKRDCHAGEWVEKEPAATYRSRLLKNVRTAIFDLRCHGVGQAVPLIDDPELVAYVAANGIRISGCPLSNLTLGLLKDVRELGIGELLDKGVIYTLNADDDLFLPPMDEVIAACCGAYGFTDAQCRKLEENVFKGAFAEDAKMR